MAVRNTFLEPREKQKGHLKIALRCPGKVCHSMPAKSESGVSLGGQANCRSMSAVPDPTSPKAPALAPGANAPVAPTPLVGLLEKDFDRLQESLDKLNSNI